MEDRKDLTGIARNTTTDAPTTCTHYYHHYHYCYYCYHPNYYGGDY